MLLPKNMHQKIIARVLGVFWFLAFWTSACSTGPERLPTPTLGREPTPTRRVTAAAPPTFVPTPVPATLTPAPSPTAPSATSTIAATATRTPTPEPTLTPKPIYPRVAAQVVRVIDGDTIEVRISGGRTVTSTVRYIGINAPEIATNGKVAEPFANDATEANKILVNGKTIYLEKDVSDTDKFGRLLRYVFLDDDTFVNADLARLGLTQVVAYPPDTRYQQILTDAQQEAYAARVGLWSDGHGDVGSSTRTPTSNARAGNATATATPRPGSGTATRTPTRGTTTPTASAGGGTTPQELVTLTSPVPRGSVVAITVQTNPNIACAAAIYFPLRPDVRSTVSSKSGICSWSWTVQTTVPAGIYTILITTGDTTRQYQLEVE
jgi:micrococcal nuclease